MVAGWMCDLARSAAAHRAVCVCVCVICKKWSSATEAMMISLSRAALHGSKDAWQRAGGSRSAIQMAASRAAEAEVHLATRALWSLSPWSAQLTTHGPGRRLCVSPETSWVP